MPAPMTAKRSDGACGAIATWALAAAQLVSWGSIYYAFSLFVVPMESALGWSRTATNAALSIGLLISGLAAYLHRNLDRSRPWPVRHGLRVYPRCSDVGALVAGSQPRDTFRRMGRSWCCDGCHALRSGLRGGHTRFP